VRQSKRRKLAAAAHCARGQLFDRMMKRWGRGAREVMRYFILAMIIIIEVVLVWLQ
jgi:hypothetical protein